MDLVEAVDVFAGGLELDLHFGAVDIGEGRTFFQLELGFGELALGGLQIDGALFGIGAILGALLFDLMAEIVVFGLGVAGGVDLSGGVEGGDQVALFDFGPVADQVSESEGSARSEDLGDENFGGVDGFDDAGEADFAVRAGGFAHDRRRGGFGNGRRGSRARRQEQDRYESGKLAHNTPHRLVSQIRRRIIRYWLM